MRAFLHLALGTLFGVALVRSGSADFDAMREMFLFRDFHLFGVALVTTTVAALAFAVARRRPWRSVSGAPIRWTPRPVHAGSVAGAVIFGLGWAVSGACPGTALAQVGEGHLVSLAIVAGIVLGNVLFEVANARYLHVEVAGCE